MVGEGEVGYRVNVCVFIKWICKKFKNVDEEFDEIINYLGFGYWWNVELKNDYSNLWRYKVLCLDICRMFVFFIYYFFYCFYIVLWLIGGGWLCEEWIFFEDDLSRGWNCCVFVVFDFWCILECWFGFFLSWVGWVLERIMKYKSIVLVLRRRKVGFFLYCVEFLVDGWFFWLGVCWFFGYWYFWEFFFVLWGW